MPRSVPADPDHPVSRWHQVIETRDPVRLAALLADEVCFHSPVVHRAQQGRALTTQYLLAAMQVFGDPSFQYVRQVIGERDAVLEFTLTLDGIIINGVDMLHWNDAGLIDDFKVMLRPLKGVNLIHEKMAAMLAAGR
ncbi:MAG: nuclear transport factor 2 family protein [Burkholderiaceae bacterium]